MYHASSIWGITGDSTRMNTHDHSRSMSKCTCVGCLLHGCSATLTSFCTTCLHHLQVTQLGHVKDLATAFVKCLGNEKAYGQIYNISGET
jgi:hypothetical protein